MKKALLLIIIFHIVFTSFASFSTHSLPQNKNDKHILMYCILHHATAKQYQSLIGRKLSLKEKINYFLLKHNFKKVTDGTGSFNLGGFILGFVLGPIGVAIAYLTSKNKRFKKWSIIGFTVLLGLVICGAIILVTAFTQF